MNLSIRDDVYVIDKAIITAFVIDPTSPQLTANGVPRSGLFWSLDIEASEESIKFYYEDVSISPLERWTDLVGKSVTWDAPKNSITGEKNGGWYGGYYLIGHHEIVQASLNFVEGDKRNIRVHWKGVCSEAPLGLSPNPDELGSFNVECWATFVGVYVFDVNVGGENATPEAKRELIGRFLELNDFQRELEKPSISPIMTPVLEPHS